MITERPSAQGASPASPWLLCRRRNPDARIRIYCFPHSGGSPAEYLCWADDLPEAEIWGVQLPGRGGRLAEAPHLEVREAVRAFVRAVEPVAPFAFFGHSLGALLAFEAARLLVARGGRAPAHLLLSAMPAPQLEFARPDVGRLPDAELLAYVDVAYGTVPAAVREDPELVKLVAPAYRADLTMVARYRYEPAEPLDVPMTLLGGADDSLSGELDGWRAHSRREPGLRLFPGGHFYLRDRHHEVMSTIRRAVLSHPEDLPVDREE
ncbi:thioesterase II family protein [Microbispora hainanensis]|uniref:thioesterase II family protein n=1 Tax=Microbispora hainanensis TaxID=568844 RepID=UPI00142EAFFE|nr:alpha/beta fold hydrolase [Microbispora hainanensis]